MDPIGVAIVTVVSKFLIDHGETLLQDCGAKAVEIARVIVSKCVEKLSETGNEKIVIQEFINDPETYKQPFAKLVDRSLENNPDFQMEMKHLLSQYDAVSSTFHKSNISVTAGGTVSQGAHNVTVGERGVIVKGDVAGSVNTGEGQVAAPHKEANDNSDG